MQLKNKTKLYINAINPIKYNKKNLGLYKKFFFIYY